MYGSYLEVPFGRGLLGRVKWHHWVRQSTVRSVDNDGFSAVEAIAPGVIDRQSGRSAVRAGYKSR
ncbi:hypothetical protein KCP73_12280 [Salmonella enterica subsp. enterica]|nr:hypothetical protein KCP73_12280 [Salmonella enterica subsp. enterica]